MLHDRVPDNTRVLIDAITGESRHNNAVLESQATDLDRLKEARCGHDGTAMCGSSDRGGFSEMNRKLRLLAVTYEIPSSR